jgi:peptidoglycan/LPS O-acetylase OafA/YrhL
VGLGEHLRGMVCPPELVGVKRYLVVDLLRGLAAIAVLVWHYQQLFFLYPGAELAASFRSSKPLYWLLGPLYELGAAAVQLFWMISGFVFCAVYASGRATTRDFIVHRLARLYPLHLLTLLMVAVLQAISFSAVGEAQLYGNNDIYHFVGQLFMASNWFPAAAVSFNGPIWSISVEVLIYAVFWATRPILYRFGVVGPAIIALLSFQAIKWAGAPPRSVWECSFYFFSGVSLCIVYLQVHDMRNALTFAAIVSLITGLTLQELAIDKLVRLELPLQSTGFVLLACAAESWSLGRVARRVAWIGDNTYGSYLWHVPIQIVALIVLDRFVGSRAVAFSPVFFLGFMTSVMLVARLSFIVFEDPMRRAIRDRFDSKFLQKAAIRSRPLHCSELRVHGPVTVESIKLPCH